MKSKVLSNDEIDFVINNNYTIFVIKYICNTTNDFQYDNDVRSHCTLYLIILQFDQTGVMS